MNRINPGTITGVYKKRSVILISSQKSIIAVYLETVTRQDTCRAYYVMDH